MSLQEQLELTAEALKEAQNSSLLAYERVNQLSQAIIERDGTIEELQSELSELYKHQAELAETTKLATARFTALETEQDSRLNHLQEI